MKQVHQLQAVHQESVKALEAFESLLRQAIPAVEEFARLNQGQHDHGAKIWIANTKEALEKWAK